MVFGLSTTSLVVVLGAGALALGPKEVPVLAKFLGRATGRAVGHVGGIRRALEKIANESELQGIQAEVRESMQDLRGVAQEIERGLHPLRGGGLHSRRTAVASGISSDSASSLSERNDVNDERVGIGRSAAGDGVRHERVIPVDARAVGATPSSGKFGLSGSDVLAASYKEREVALKANRMMESGAIDEYLAKREREG